VPKDSAIRQVLLRNHHDDPTAGHFAARKMQELMERKYYWESIRKDVEDYTGACPVCQRKKPSRLKKYGQLSSLPIPDGPGESYSMDLIVGLPPSKLRGIVYDAILVIVDRYSKLSRYIPTNSTMSAPDLADLFFDRIIVDKGAPLSLISDRGSIFASKYWTDFCQHLRIDRRLSTAFHPQTDGQTERQNQTLEFYLRAFTNYRQDDWSTWLSTAEFAYNNAQHASTGKSPFFLERGFHPNLPTDILLSDFSVQSVEDRLTELEKVRQLAKERLQAAVEAQARYYDKKHRPISYQIGDEVLLSTEHIRTLRPSKKLDDNFLGPLPIIGVVGRQAYTLRLPPLYKKLCPTFHVSLLKPWIPREGDEESTRTNPIDVAGHKEWYVEKILSHRKVRKHWLFLVKWEGYPDYECSWEPVEHLENAQKELNRYRKAVSLDDAELLLPKKKYQRKTATIATSVKRKRGRPLKK
jgi:hypothetical protein